MYLKTKSYLSHSLGGHPTLKNLRLWQRLLTDPTLEVSHDYHLRYHAHQVGLNWGYSPFPSSLD